MQPRRVHLLLSSLVGYGILVYGLLIIAASFEHQLQQHGRHDFDAILVSLPSLIGLSYVYLANLLLRLKYNAWLIAVLLSASDGLLGLYEFSRHLDSAPSMLRWVRLIVPFMVLTVLLIARRLFQVRSDMRSFTEAVRTSLVVLLIAFIYGLGGFTLLDTHDFHQEISLASAVHQTVDQFGLTTATVVPHTRRARLFVDSLSTISTAAVIYVALSFFQPLRMRLANQTRQRELAEKLLRKYPSDVDDFFKLWPHDKHYFFDSSAEAGLAYHVARGVALVVADPFGKPTHFKRLIEQFQELCFVNDWTPSFIHVGTKNRKLYQSLGYRLQKLGEEAVLNVADFEADKNSKYFRQIRNRFTKLGYTVELLEPPHSPALLSRLHAISNEWLNRPGRTERGFMLGFYSDEYMQAGPVAIVRDEAQQIQGFINLVPTFEPGTANYDLLRCAEHAPGNCNDFLLLGLLDILQQRGVTTLNLGLCPLSGLDEKSENAGLIHNTLRFVFSNGDRLYSFSGLRRFKEKYKPDWHDRYIAYRGGVPGFTKAMTALSRAMKIK